MPTTTPLMNLVLPDVSLTAGPLWASYLNAAFTLVDGHDHSAGKGPRITPSGININADLAFAGFNASGLRVARFNAQGATLSGGTEIRQIYFVGVEAYINDGNGNAIKVTNAGALNVAGVAGIGGDYGGANPAALNFVEATSTYEFYENPGAVSFGNLKFLGLDSRGSWRIASTVISGSTVLTDSDNNIALLVDTSAARTLTLPDPTLGKRLFIIKDKTGSSETNAITLARNGVETIDGVAANKSLSKNFGIWYILSDGTNWWVLKDDVVNPISGSVFVDTGNGTGSTNTRVRRFVNTRLSQGTSITYADSATNGGSFTINENGIYSITYCETDTGGAGAITTAGITINGSALTTNILGLSYAQGRRAHFPIDTSNNSGGTSVTLRLASGDVVRAQTDNVGNPGGENDDTLFSITQVAKI